MSNRTEQLAALIDGSREFERADLADVGRANFDLTGNTGGMFAKAKLRAIACTFAIAVVSWHAPSAAAAVDANKPGPLPQVWGLEMPESTAKAAASQYRRCALDGSFTSNSAVTHFAASKATRFSLKLGNPPRSYRKFRGALVSPRGKVTCLSYKPVEVELLPGRYAIHIFSDTTMSNRVLLVVDRPGEEERLVKRARTSAPKLAPSTDGHNPFRGTLTSVVPSLRATTLGLACADKVAVRDVTLAGRLVLPVGSRWTIRNLDTANPHYNKVFLRNAETPCAAGGGDLDAGTYDVFLPTIVFKRNPKIRVSVEDLDRPLWFGKAAEHTVGALTVPQWIPLGKRSENGAPDAVLKFNNKVAGVWIELVTLGKATDPTVKRFDRKTFSDSRFSKQVVKPGQTVAVFAKDRRPGAQRNAARWLLVRRAEADNTPMKTLLKQTGNPLARPKVNGRLPLAHRELRYVFPYLPSGKSIHVDGFHSVDELFLAAPETLLFLKRGSGGAKRGEPVLLVRWGAKRSTVVRANGKKLEVRTERLSTTPIADALDWSWTFQDNRAPRKLRSYTDVIKADYYLPLSSRPRFAVWRDKSMKIGKCMRRYLEKHDPSYNKPYELIYVSSGRNVGDVMSKRARRKCGAARHDKRGEAIITKEIALEKKRRAGLAKKLRALSQHPPSP